MARHSNLLHTTLTFIYYLYSSTTFYISFHFIPVFRDIGFTWTKICPTSPESRLLHSRRPGFHVNTTEKQTVNYQQAKNPVHRDNPVYQDHINQSLAKVSDSNILKRDYRKRDSLGIFSSK